MKSWKKWLLLSGAFYLFFLIWQTPAELCWRWLAPDSGPTANLSMYGFEGSWSCGRLASLRSGSLRLTDLAWSFRPLWLLAGRLEFDLRAGLSDADRVETKVAISRKRLGIRNLHGRFPINRLGEALLPGLGLTGELSSQGLNLSLEQGRPHKAEGTLNWQNAELSFPKPLALGDLELSLTTEAETIFATIQDQGGPLLVNVQARIKRDGNFELNGELMPRGPLRPEQASLLGLLGTPAADGRVRLQRAGQLPPIY